MTSVHQKHEMVAWEQVVLMAALITTTTLRSSAGSSKWAWKPAGWASEKVYVAHLAHLGHISYPSGINSAPKDL